MSKKKKVKVIETSETSTDVINREVVTTTLGAVAYEAYRLKSGGVSLVSGQPIPVFEGLSPDIREAWETAANAVAAAVAISGVDTAAEAPAASGGGHYVRQSSAILDGITPQGG